MQYARATNDKSADQETNEHGSGSIQVAAELFAQLAKKLYAARPWPNHFPLLCKPQEKFIERFLFLRRAQNFNATQKIIDLGEHKIMLAFGGQSNFGGGVELDTATFAIDAKFG